MDMQSMAMRMAGRAGVLASALVLAACTATSVVIPERAPVVPPVAPVVMPHPEPVPAPLPPAETVPVPEAPVRAISPAVQSLLAQAEQQRRRGDLVTASSILERVVRIAPQEPTGFEALARLRLQQGRLPEAEQLALKAASLRGLSAPERERLWNLVGECRDRQGNRSGGDEARNHAVAN